MPSPPSCALGAYSPFNLIYFRLLNKLGCDLLGSVVHKINRTLDVVRESFNYEEQLIIIFKYITDQTQTPNSKVISLKIETKVYKEKLLRGRRVSLTNLKTFGNPVFIF